MTTLTEGNLQITFNDAISARKFDDDSHGLSHCMKAVDFIIEFPDCYWFIEVKNLDAPKVPEKERKKYMNRLQSPKMIKHLKYKYRDSFLYEWASGRADKPIDYLILIGLKTLESPLLMERTNALQRNLPTSQPSQLKWPWCRSIVRNCGVFNIASWNRKFPDYQVKILP